MQNVANLYKNGFFITNLKNKIYRVNQKNFFPLYSFFISNGVNVMVDFFLVTEQIRDRYCLFAKKLYHKTPLLLFQLRAYFCVETFSITPLNVGFFFFCFFFTKRNLL